MTLLLPKGDEYSSAVFSIDEVYRYTLHRNVYPGMTEPLESQGMRALRLLWLMLNPSKADHRFNDQTIQRVIRYTRYWGYGYADVGNLYALRSTDPGMLWTVDDPVGPENDRLIRGMLDQDSAVVVAWGANAQPERADLVLAMIEELGHTPLALGLTQSGQPVHPLRQRKDLRPRQLRELRDEQSRAEAVQQSH